MKKYSIEDMKRIAHKRGGECLSNEYLGSHTKLKWRCKQGHEWEATPDNIKHGKWCAICSRKIAGLKRRYTIEGMQKLAKERGGECLSKEYLGIREKHIWKCKEGHVFETVASNVKQGQWCKICSYKERGSIQWKYSIEDLKGHAIEKNGKCLSDVYVGGKKYYEWQCKKGHKWMASWDNVMRGKWRPHCASTQKKTIGDMKELARLRGGECLSDVYENDRTDLIWKCKVGHTWNAKPNYIKQGTWCPICSSYRRERSCKKIFELLFQEKFNKSRPKWLKDKRTKRNLELDGYCRKLKIAFEYQGQQHFFMWKYTVN